MAKKRITFKELLSSGLLPWKSYKTTVRRIKDSDFPATWDGYRYYFELSAVEAWFKRRTSNNAA